MRTLGLRLTLVLAVSLLAASCGTTTPVAAHVPADVSDQRTSQIVDKYLNARQTQEAALNGMEMEADIDAKLPALEKQGKLRALRKISKIGLITYKALGFSGDDTIKKEVISRYLSAESEAKDLGSIAITPQNYKFKYRGVMYRANGDLYVLQLTPRKNVVGLFKGELWVDAKTFMPVRESGTFVKSPSIFLKKIEFVRDYEMRNGVSVPTHIQSTVDTRLVGRAELSINFSNFAKDSADAENNR